MEPMIRCDTGDLMRALLLVMLPLAGGCFFDSMGLPSSSPPGTDNAGSPEWRHDLQPQDLSVHELSPYDQSPNEQALHDLPPPVDGKPDKAVTDAPKTPDKYVTPPDLGCPAGKTACGSLCVELSKDVKNCGKCGKACDLKSSDSCNSGKCVCGQGGIKACGGGLNCKQGTCQCVTGSTSSCSGCCENNVCYLPATTGGQNAKRCGPKGTKCQSCDDNKVCTFDGCGSTGVCYHSNQPATVTCDDNSICTSSDKCAAGVCKGTTKDCTSLDGPCHTGVCNASLFGICEQKAKANKTPCKIPGPCMTKGKCWCQSGLCMVIP